MEDHYFIYLSFNNQAEGWRLPVNPESIEISEEGQGKTYNIVGKGGGTEETRAGEINVIQSPKLRTVSFSSFFPSKSHNYPFIVQGIREFNKDYQYLSDGIHSPMKYVRDIRKWMETKHPIRFMYIVRRKREDGTLDKEGDRDLNFPASIEKFEWKEVAGSPGDIEYSLSLKEYVFYSARNIPIVVDANGETALIQKPERPKERVIPETYALVKDDWLIKVALKFYNDSSRARDIQKLNRIRNSKLRYLPIGMVLKLPPK
ncbi:peptidoglycan-binding protein LysM [Paenibacillus sp. MZ04-78.2]|uniref:peptidoglycan-binding protein LysM n=1 Tax=Paenibacillus sp. MZ04-78.2 TaxID=2962034 RepID=UPI0020B8B270|nr:peptidoglycan-binding protein LysM [Paenibacillus sp. MZ04-78.2]MCP3773660.1 peptidoglycan-binding protein LysM [Paenibacillus sp. MZ04-78.2]